MGQSGQKGQVFRFACVGVVEYLTSENVTPVNVFQIDEQPPTSKDTVRALIASGPRALFGRDIVESSQLSNTLVQGFTPNILHAALYTKFGRSLLEIFKV